MKRKRVVIIKFIMGQCWSDSKLQGDRFQVEKKVMLPR